MSAGNPSGRATGRRTRRPLVVRWAQLLAGLAIFGLAVDLMIRSGLGLGPWDAFHVGLSRVTGISVGVATIATGLAIVVGALFIGIRPGVGTLANMVLVGAFVDVFLPLLPPAGHWTWGLAYYVAGILLTGFATGLYIGAGLGAGPRDGLMVGLSARTGRSVRLVRTLIELGALLFGWLMGGTLGVGTVLFTVAVGPSAQWGLRLFGALPTPGAGGEDSPPGRARAA